MTPHTTRQLYERRERIDAWLAENYPAVSTTDRLIAATIADYSMHGATDYAEGVRWAAYAMHPKRADTLNRIAGKAIRAEKGWAV